MTRRHGVPRILVAVLLLAFPAAGAQVFAPRADLANPITFSVTSTADSGPGSLRQVMNDVNAQCLRFDIHQPCIIDFKLSTPVPAEGWYTIEPLSPLPVFMADDVTIDAETQTALTGDTNPLGPEVFLLGDRAGATDGLATAGGLALRGVAIGGFAGNGVTVFAGTIERNYVGLDPTGTHAVPNGLNGVNAKSPRGTITIDRNVISGNRGSGIDLDSFSNTFTISNNRIGVAAQSDDPVPNGTSGIFVAHAAVFFGAQIEGNVIQFNNESGIEIQGDGVRILDNVVARNGNRAIRVVDSSGRSVQGPTVEFATFDAQSGQTVVNGTGAVTGLLSTYQQTATVYLYANDAAVSEGQRFIGSSMTDSQGHFSLAVNADLRGLWITGTTDRVIDFHDFVSRNSSEFGPPHPVTTDPARRRIVRR
ncbi:MAG TPA: right-handed parallel beta-helix repeat-containing protein [Thermoanaerobaculia bacterium]